MNHLEEFQKYMETSIINVNKGELNFKRYLSIIQSFVDVRLATHSYPLAAIAGMIQEYIKDDTEEVNALKYGVKILYVPLKLWLKESRIKIKFISKGTYYIYIYNGKFWEEERNPISICRNILRIMGYNSDLVLEPFVTKIIIETISFIEEKMEEQCDNAINLQNGVLIFTDTDVEFVKHSPSYFFKDIRPFEYDETKECPRYTQSLVDLLTEEHSKLYMNILASAFSPEPMHSKLLFMIGAAGSGKSLAMDIPKLTLGDDIAHEGKLNDLLESRGGFSISTTLRKVGSKKLFFAHESEGGSKILFNNVNFKTMIERKPMNIDQGSNLGLAEDIVAPLIIASANREFDLSVIDDGVARRIIFIFIKPRKNILVEDTSLARTISQEEGAGIINLIVKHYRYIKNNPNDIHRFSNEESNKLRLDNAFYTNLAPSILTMAFECSYLELLSPEVPKNKWLKTALTIKELGATYDNVVKTQINCGRTVARQLKNFHMEGLIFDKSEKTGVFNACWTKSGKEFIERTKIEILEERIKDRELGYAN